MQSISTKPDDSVPIRRATEDEYTHVIDTLVSAFTDDPVTRWFFKEDALFREIFPKFIPVFARGAFADGTVFHTGEYEAAALWHGPDSLPPDEETLIAMMHEAVSQDTFDHAMVMFEQLGEYHPKTPHYYLSMIGVCPEHRNKGLGSTLMVNQLAVCDHEGLPAYLESSNPRNLPFYERHGFKIIGEIPAGEELILYPMLREPKN